jgi:hypothetical protein
MITNNRVRFKTLETVKTHTAWKKKTCYHQHELIYEEHPYLYGMSNNRGQKFCPVFKVVDDLEVNAWFIYYEDIRG